MRFTTFLYILILISVASVGGYYISGNLKNEPSSTTVKMTQYKKEVITNSPQPTTIKQTNQAVQTAVATPISLKTAVYADLYKVEGTTLLKASNTYNCDNTGVEAVNNAVSTNNSMIQSIFNDKYTPCYRGTKMGKCMDECREKDYPADVYGICLDGCKSYDTQQECDGYKNDINERYESVKKVINQYCS